MLGAFRVLASDRYLEKGMDLMALTGRRLAEIFLAPASGNGEVAAGLLRLFVLD